MHFQIHVCAVLMCYFNLLRKTGPLTSIHIRKIELQIECLAFNRKYKLHSLPFNDLLPNLKPKQQFAKFSETSLRWYFLFALFLIFICYIWFAKHVHNNNSYFYDAINQTTELENHTISFLVSLVSSQFQFHLIEFQPSSYYGNIRFIVIYDMENSE